MKAIIITASVFLFLYIGTLGYVIGLSQGLPHEKNKRFKYVGYESDDTNYTKGQILLPDMVHSDTLIVTDGAYLNECLARPDVGSDDDLFEILNETTVRYSLLPNTIIKQETDERGLTSVQYIKDGQQWALDYLTKREYDSAFHDYVNYKNTEDNSWIRLGGKPVHIIN